MNKLLIIDGLNIVRRVYEANANAPDSDEKAARAMVNAMSSFRKILGTHQPTHALAAFDFGGNTWRHDLYPQYRQDRKPMPDPLRAAMPGFHKSLTDIGLAVVCVPECEADDVVGAVTLRWLAEGRGVAVVCSTDKDLHVLIEQGALLWDHFKGEWHDRAWVKNKFGIEVEMLADYLALMGDATDGVPGVSKIGAKTAAKLLNSYKTLDGVLAGAGILMNPLGVKLRAEAGMARLSRQLVQLKADVRVGVTWSMLKYSA
jgi:DNA polymerase-1